MAALWAVVALTAMTAAAAAGLTTASSSLSSPVPADEFRIVLGDQVFFGDANVTAEARWALNRSWQSFCTITSDETTTSLDYQRAHERGWRTILAVNANPIELARTATDKDRAEINLTLVVATQLANLGGRPLVWEYLCEDDSSGTGFSFDLLKAARAAVLAGRRLSPPEAAALFDDYLAAALNSTSAHVHGADNVALHRNAKFGFPSSAHAIARAGADTLVLERDNDDVGTLAVGMAFLRGAASQYGLSWGIDLSLWWGVIGGCVNELPASYHIRTLHMAYLSGAALVEIEGCGWLDTLPGGGRSPYPISSAVDGFGQFVHGTLQPAQRGRPDSLVALLLPHDHGFDERPSWADAATSWNYAKLPARRGGRSIAGLFSAAFPGTDRFSFFAFPFGEFGDGGPDDPPSPFALSAITPKYAPDKADVHYASAPLPFGQFKSRKEASKYMKATRRDPARYRPMVDTRWGNIFDVMVAPLPGAAKRQMSQIGTVLSRYPIVVLLGDQLVSEEMTEILQNFAKLGGIVVIAAGTALPSHASLLTGLNMTGETLASRAWQWVADDAAVPVHEALLVAASTVVHNSNTSVLAVSLPMRHPMVTRRYIGEGAVYTCAVPWFEGAGRDLSELALRLLDSIILPLQPVTIDGLPLEWTSTTRTDDSKIVALSNHAEGSWHGSVNVRSPTTCRSFACRELRHNTSCVAEPHSDGIQVKLEIPAFDIVVLELAPRCTSAFAQKTDDDALSRTAAEFEMQFAGGTLRVNTGTGAFSVMVEGMQTIHSAPYEVWFDGKLYSTKDASLLLRNSTHGEMKKDPIGESQSLALTWSSSDASAGGLSWVTTFRAYTSGPMVFEQAFPLGWTSGLGERSDVDVPATAFPSFQLDDSITKDLTLVTFRGQNAAQTTHYGRWPLSYRGGYLGGPVCFVADDLGSAMVMSPLNNFMITEHNIKTCTAPPAEGNCTALQYGVQGLIQQLPPKTRLEFVLNVFLAKQRGYVQARPTAGMVAAAFMSWGDMLLRYHEKNRTLPNASVAISRLGYSTTGIYHYNPCDCVNNSDGERCHTSSPHLPGCETYEDTLLAIHHDSIGRGINYSWWLIDSWWHAYDQDKYFEDVPEQVSEMFPRGLSWLANQLVGSFSAHWSSKFGQQSPYRKIGAPGSWHCSKESCIPTDSAVWDHVFESDESWRLRTIKVDHMLSTLVGSAADNGDGTCPGPRGWPHPGHECKPGERTALIRNHSEAVLACLTSPSVAQAFLSALAHSAARHGVTIEWCMSYPNVLMESLATGNASTHARGSDDSHPVGAGTVDGHIGYTFNNWHGFAGESTFIWALGLWPFKDTFYSNSSVTPLNKFAEDYLGHEPRPFTHALVAALGGGGVANGDPVGSTDATLLMLTCTATGQLLKPTMPAMYIDRTWLRDAPVGETALAVSTIGGLSWRMIYSINSAGFELTASDVGITEPALVYAYCGPRPLTRAGCDQPGVRGLQRLGAGVKLRVPAAAHDLEAQYHVVAPVIQPAGVSGPSWSLLGEWPKLVPVSEQRFVSIETTAEALEVTLVGDEDERVDLIAAIRSPSSSPRATSWRVVALTCHFGPSGARHVARWSATGEATCGEEVVR